MALQNKELGCCDDLTLSQCHLLLTVAELREADVVQLAECLGLDKSTLGRLNIFANCIRPMRS
jgi:DNA-binding MarR family transcriptional regulator